MKLRLEAEPAELQTRGHELVRQLSKALHQHVPDLADGLLKAIPERPVPEIKHKVLQDSMAATRAAYERMLQEMLTEIGMALDERADEMEGLKKSGPDYTTDMRAEDQAELTAIRKKLSSWYEPRDFAAGGMLYGQSLATLRELLAQHK